MNYSKKENEEFALKLLLMEALAVRGQRVENKRLKAIIRLLETSKDTIN